MMATFCSFCLLLCLVASVQSLVAFGKSRKTTEAVTEESSSDLTTPSSIENNSTSQSTETDTAAANRSNQFELPILVNGSDISDPAGDRNAAYYSEVFLGTLKNMGLFRRKQNTRKIMNLKIHAYILSKVYERYKDSKGAQEVEDSDPSLENAVIARLHPDSCVKEFSKGFLCYHGLLECNLEGSKCDVKIIYSSQWYKTICREFMKADGGGEEETLELCGAS